MSDVHTSFVPSDPGAVILQAKRDLYFTTNGAHDSAPVLFMKKDELRVMRGARAHMPGYGYIEYDQDNFRFFLAADALKEQAGQGTATLDSLTTPTTAVYQRPHDKEAGHPPLFEHRTEITKIQPGVKIGGVEVNYEVPDSGI